MRALVALMLAIAALTCSAHESALHLDEIGFDQRLDQRLPLDARFTDDSGDSASLAAMVDGKPAVLVFNYFDCPNLCSVVLRSVFETITHPAFGLTLGRDFNLIAVSIDPREGPALAATKKAEYLRNHPRAGNGTGVHFPTGTQDNIDRVARAAGFRYRYDDELQQYAHAAGVVVVTGDGRIARYLFGAQFPPHALRLALIEASQNRIGALIDQVWLLCFHYDPVRGRYGVAIVNVLRAAGALVVIALVTYVVFALRRERSAMRAVR